MRILLIRHGRQSDTRCNVDVGLSAEGRQQADLAGRRMAGWGIDALYASDMIRAVETARIMGGHVGLDPQIIPALRELDFGDMTGLLDEDIAVRFGDFQREQALMEQDLHYPGGESVGDLMGRVLPALDELTRSGHRTIAIATHGVVIRGLITSILGAPLQHWRLAATTLENGSLTEVDWSADESRFRLQRVNDYAHLEGSPELLRSAWGVKEN